jgi:hypothetical protein
MTLIIEWNIPVTEMILDSKLWQINEERKKNSIEKQHETSLFREKISFCNLKYFK